jgi:hypothetical protein
VQLITTWHTCSSNHSTLHAADPPSMVTSAVLLGPNVMVPASSVAEQPAAAGAIELRA